MRGSWSRGANGPSGVTPLAPTRGFPSSRRLGSRILHAAALTGRITQRAVIKVSSHGACELIPRINVRERCVAPAYSDTTAIGTLRG